tara:strand:- start:73 stop:1185 length:1113 start_codon:yes stop_codon:yes gene_type:complete
MNEVNLKNHVVITALRRSGGSMFCRLFDGHPNVAAFATQGKFGDAQAEESPKSCEAFPKKINGTIKEILTRHQRFNAYGDIIYKKKKAKGTSIEFDKNEFERLISRKLYKNNNIALFREMVLESFFRSHALYKESWKNIDTIVWHNTYVHYFVDDLVVRDKTKVLMLFRHPMDNFSSMLKLKGENIDLKSEILSYRDAYFAAVHFQNKFKDFVKIIRYEDLVKQTKKTMRDVARFLNIKMDVKLLSPTMFNEPWTGISGFDRPRKISTNAIGRFDNFLSNKDRTLIYENLCDVMGSLGYLNKKPFVTKFKINTNLDNFTNLLKNNKNYYFRFRNEYPSLLSHYKRLNITKKLPPSLYNILKNFIKSIFRY